MYLGFFKCLIIIFKRDMIEIGMFNKLNVYLFGVFRSDKFFIYYV